MKIDCKFCNQLRESVRSHLTPKSAVPKDIKMNTIHSNGRSHGKIGSGMLFDEEILCEICEPKFSNVDDKFYDFISRVKAAKKFPTDTASEFFRLNVDVDLEWLDVFSASLLYRHSISRRSKVKLGEGYEKVAKEMIEKYNTKQSVAVEQKIFSAFCIINTSRVISKDVVAMEIAQNKYRGIRIYNLILSGGIEIRIKVSNQENPLLKLRDDKCIVGLGFNDSMDDALMERFIKSAKIKIEKNSKRK